VPWEVEVEGPDSILYQLALAISDRDLALVKRGDAFVLNGSRLDAFDEPCSVGREAERIVSLLSSAARLSLGSTASLRAGAVVERTFDHREPCACDDPHAWSRRSSLSTSIREALSSPAMERALRLRDGEPSKADFIQIYDIFEKEVGDRRAAAALCGITVATIVRLHRKHPTRHAPMTLEETRRFVDRVLMAWLGSCGRAIGNRKSEIGNRNSQRVNLSKEWAISDFRSPISDF
jgi:hypothetical protein